jgi:hypothetical protein
LIASQRSIVTGDLFKTLPLEPSLEILSIPSTPLEFDGINFCFHDELIGDPNAFLIHYGASSFDVSGFHYPISAISVPIGEQLSALLIARIPYDNGEKDQRETCVMELNAQGVLLKGPWWPRLDRAQRK